MDKKKAEREKRDQLEPEALVRTHKPCGVGLHLDLSSTRLSWVCWCRQRKAEEKERKKQLRKRGPQAKSVLPLFLSSLSLRV